MKYWYFTLRCSEEFKVRDRVLLGAEFFSEFRAYDCGDVVRSGQCVWARSDNRGTHLSHEHIALFHGITGVVSLSVRV